MNSLSSRLALAQARTIRSSVWRLECSACSPRSPSCRPRRRSAASSPCFSPRLPACRVRASRRRSPKRCSSSRQAAWARGRSLWTLALLPSSATKRRRPGARGLSRRRTGHGGSPPTGTAPRPSRRRTPSASMNCSQISAHRSSASSGSCGCKRQRAVPHVRVSRVPISRPFWSRSAIVTRVPKASRGSSRNRASAIASRRSSSLQPPPSGPPPASRRPGAGRGAPRACPSRPGRAARRVSCRRG